MTTRYDREADPAPPGSRMAAALCATYAFLVSFLLGALFVARYAVNVPIWDEWVMTPLLAHHRAGTLGWQELFAQHNEHRFLTSRLAIVGLYDLFGQWNLVAEMAFSALLLGLTVGLLAYTLHRIGVAPIVSLLLAILLTSPVQWENQLMGVQVQVLTTNLGFVAALCVATLDAALGWRTIAAAIVGCTVSTFGLSSGLLSWGAVGGALLVRALLISGSWRALAATPAMWRRLAAFALGAVVCTALFLHGYQVAPGSGRFRPRHLDTFLGWLPKVLVYPVLETPTPLTAALAAALLLFLAAATLFYLRRWRQPFVRDRLVLFAGLGAMLLASALITAYGRAAIGPVPSRYGTMFLFNTVLILVAAADLVRDRWARPRAGAVVALCGALLAGFLMTHAHAFVAGLATMQDQDVNRRTARQSVVDYLRDHSPGLPFSGYPIFPMQAVHMGSLARPELLATLPPDMVPPWSALPSQTSGDAWCRDCAFEGTSGRAPSEHWGSWRHAGPTATGRIRVGPVAIREPMLAIPIAGYAGAAGNMLRIEDADDPGHWIAYAGPSPGETWATWWADVSSFVGRDVFLVGIDDTTLGAAWLAFGPPRPANRALWLFEMLLAQTGTMLLVVACTGGGLLLALAHLPVTPRTGAATRLLALGSGAILVVCVVAGAAWLVRQARAPDQVAARDAVWARDGQLDLLAHLPPHTVDGRHVRRFREALYMHPDTTRRLGPFRAPSGTCFLAQAGFRPGFPNRRGIDGVQFDYAVVAGDETVEAGSAPLRVHEWRDIAARVPTDTPFFLVLTTRQRQNDMWDRAVWRSPRLGPCPP